MSVAEAPPVSTTSPVMLPLGDRELRFYDVVGEDKHALVVAGSHLHAVYLGREVGITDAAAAVADTPSCVMILTAGVVSWWERDDVEGQCFHR